VTVSLLRRLGDLFRDDIPHLTDVFEAGDSTLGIALEGAGAVRIIVGDAALVLDDGKSIRTVLDVDDL
jgi:hypothetical protein